MWAFLAALALQGSDLECAELCLAAIDEVDKLHFIQARWLRFPTIIGTPIIANMLSMTPFCNCTKNNKLWVGFRQCFFTLSQKMSQ